MKRKSLIFILLALLTVSIIVPVNAKDKPFLVVQCEITDFIYIDTIAEGMLFDVPFEGTAGGPGAKDGTVEGVDHFLWGWDGTGYLNVYWTMTDNEGDKFSVHVTGTSHGVTPGLIVFEDAWATVIDSGDYPTSGKYDELVNEVFKDEGFITEFTASPPGGTLHVKLYWFEPE